MTSPGRPTPARGSQVLEPRADDAPVASPVAAGDDRVSARLAARAALAAAAAGFVALVGAAALRNHHDFKNAGFDFAIFDQGLWLLSRFREPFVTTLGLNLFGDHTSFLLVLLAPLYWLVPSAEALLVVQAAALGLGALPVFLIAREKLRDEWLACGAGVAYLLHPAVAWTGLDEFHPEAFEVPLLLFALYFMIRRRWGLFLLLVAALLLVKEDVALLTVALGLYVALFHHRRVGLAVSGLSVLWFLLATYVVLPGFNGVGTLDSWRVPYGGTRGLVKAVFTKPWDVAELLLGASRRAYLAALFVPVALLSLAALPLLLVGIGPLLSNLLSTWPYQRDVQFSHYSTLLVPIVVVSAVFGVATLGTTRRRARLATATLVAAALAGSVAWGPLSGDEPLSWSAGPPRAAIGPAHEAIDLVPDGASVATMVQLAPHLAHRRELYLFPNPWLDLGAGDLDRQEARPSAAAKVDYILLTSAYVERYPGARPLFEQLEKREFRRVFDAKGVVLLERVAEAA